MTYRVLATDYVTFAIEYTCQDKKGSYNVDYAVLRSLDLTNVRYIEEV